MAEEALTPRSIKEPSYTDAIIPAVTLIVLIAGAVFLFGLDALDGAIQVALLLSAMVTSLIILKNGHSWDEIVIVLFIASRSITTIPRRIWDGINDQLDPIIAAVAVVSNSVLPLKVVLVRMLEIWLDSWVTSACMLARSLSW